MTGQRKIVAKYQAWNFRNCGYAPRTMHYEEPSLADHAEAWWREKDFTVPERGSKEWWAMYEKWIDYAFQQMESLTTT